MEDLFWVDGCLISDKKLWIRSLNLQNFYFVFVCVFVFGFSLNFLSSLRFGA